MALQHPERLSSVAEFEGRVLAIDRAAHQLRVQDDQGKVLEISVPADTPIKDSSNRWLKVDDLREKDSLRIIYTTYDMSARQVDRIFSRHFTIDAIFSAV